MKLKPTFAPIWFPHWPAWMWTISLMVRSGCGQSWVRSSVRYPANQHLDHFSDGCGAGDTHAAGRMTWRAASLYPSQPIGTSRFDAVAHRILLHHPGRPPKTAKYIMYFRAFWYPFLHILLKRSKTTIHWSINSGLFYQYIWLIYKCIMLKQKETKQLEIINDAIHDSFSFTFIEVPRQVSQGCWTWNVYMEILCL